MTATLLRNSVLLFALVLTTIVANAQTTLYFETFNSGSSATWSLNTTDNGSDPANTNYWVINNTYNGGFLGGTTPNEPAAVTGNPQSYYMHIQNDLAGNASFQGPMTGDVFTKMNTAIVTTGYTGVAFNFWYLSKGHNTSTTAYVGRVYYSINGGNNWLLLASYTQIAAWTNANITNAAFDNQADLRFAFMWHQAGGSGAKDPCLAVDELKVTGTISTPCGVTITNQSSTPLTCNNSNNGTITITATGATVYTINSGTPVSNGTGVFTGLSAGTYTVSAGDGSCTTNGTNIVLTNPTAVPAPVASSNTPLCEGATLQLNATAVSGASYNWTGPNNFSNTQNPSKANIVLADAGTYSVIATVGSCNSAAATTTVVINPIPASPTASNNGPLCSGATLQLSATTVTGATYNWTGPNNFTNQQNPSKANTAVADTGTYNVVAVVSGCSSPSASTAVVINQTPTAPVASSNSPLCVGDNLQLNATTVAGASYNWTGPNNFTNQQNPSKTNVVLGDGGTYSVIATIGSCSSSAATTVVSVNTTPAAPTASSNSPICAGTTLQLNATNVSGATYNWTGPNNFTNQQNPSKSNTVAGDAGTYTVIASIGSCNSAPATTTVVVNPIPSAPTASNNGPLCAGATLQLNATTITGATYNWTGPNIFNNQQNPSKANAAVSDAGTYSVIATVNGCNSTAATTTVVINALPSAPVASSNTPLCVGGTLQLNASAISGATYNWTGPNNFTNQQNPSKANVVLGDAGTYSVVATVNGCNSSSASTAVIVNSIPSAPTASNNGPVCSGASLQLSATTVTGATYNWTGPNNFTNQQNPTVANSNVSDAGTYTVVAVVNGCNSASSSTTAVVNATPAAPVASSNSPLCVGDNLQLNATTVTGASYNWTGPNNFTNQQNPTIANVVLGDAGTYSVIATVAGCNSAAATATVSVNNVPAAPVASSNSTVCEGTTLNLTASTISGASYSWTGPNSFSQQNPSKANAAGVDSGTYTVVATIGSCVSAPGTTHVSVDPTPASPVASSNGPLCEGATLNLSATGGNGATYSWTGPSSFNQQNPSKPNITQADTGTYTVVVTLGSCSSSPSISSSTYVTINTNPTLTITANPAVICSNDSSLICAAGFSSYLWSTGATTACITAKQAGNYYVTVTDANGCSAESNHVGVTVYPVPSVSISVQGDTLSSFNASSYQWYMNGSVIGGAIASQYIATVTGAYAVEITDSNGCTALSNAVNVVITGLHETTISTRFEIYPNPTKDVLMIVWKDGSNAERLIEILDITGRKIYSSKTFSGTQVIDVSEFAQGVYLIKAGNNLQKFMKE